MLNTEDYAQTPLAPLSMWIGHLWSGIFGYNLLNLRILSAIYIALSMVLPCVLLYRRTQMADISLALFGIGCAWLALVPSKSFLWGWDSLSTLILMATTCLCISYLHRASIAKTVMLGLCAAMAVLARVPNVVAAAVVLALIAYSTPRGQKLKASLIFSVVLLVALIACVIAFYGSIQAYIDTLTANTISGHSVGYLFDGYLRTTTAWMQFTCLVGAILIFATIFPTIPAVGAVTILLALVTNLPEFPFFATPCYMSLGLLTCALIYVRPHRAVVIFLAAMAISATAGSDLGLEKTITLQMLPLVLSLLAPEQRKPLILTTLATFTIALWTNLPVQAESSFEDRGFLRTTSLVTTTPYSGIYTTPERNSEIQQLDSIIAAWERTGGRVLVIGDCFHYGAQLLSQTPQPHP